MTLRIDAIKANAKVIAAQMAAYDAAHPEIAAVCDEGVRDYENRQARRDGLKPNRDSGLTAENVYDLDTETA